MSERKYIFTVFRLLKDSCNCNFTPQNGISGIKKTLIWFEDTNSVATLKIRPTDLTAGHISVKMRTESLTH